MEKPPPFTQTINNATGFFSLVLGVGLSQILDRESFHETFPSDRWYCFVAALLLFLRFLFGSANHLWKEFGAVEYSEGARTSIIWHLACLIIFGFIAVRICYSRNVLDFLVWQMAFGAVAAIFALPGLRRGKPRDPPDENWSRDWFFINIIQAIIACGIFIWFECEKAHRGMLSSYHLPLACLVVTFVILLWYDLRFQLERMGAAAGKGTTQTGTAPALADKPKENAEKVVNVPAPAEPPPKPVVPDETGDTGET